MTRALIAYDCERVGDCLRAVLPIVQTHEKYGIPATFFLVGELLDVSNDWPDLLDCPLFDVGSHGWSHALMVDAPNGDPAVHDDRRREELARSKKRIEEEFWRPCDGIRIPNGHPDGLLADPWLLSEVKRVGYRYSSSQLWGSGYTHAPVRGCYRYLNGLVEFPTHGAHDTHLPDHGLQTASYFTGYATLARRLPKEPEYLSFVWHPWRLSEVGVDVKEILRVLVDDGFEFGTFAQEYARVAQREGVAA